MYVCIYTVYGTGKETENEKANQRKRKKERIESVEDMYECTN